MNWIRDCSISSALECWPDKLQTCNCRSKWSVNACLSCSGKAVFWAQLNARRHKEVLHQCVWSNSSILHLVPAAEKDESCNKVFSGKISHQKPALSIAFEVYCPWIGWPQPQQKGEAAMQVLGRHRKAVTLPRQKRRALATSVLEQVTQLSPSPQQRYCPSCLQWWC